MNNIRELPKIDNARATDADRQRFLQLAGCRVIPPQHTSRNYFLERPGGAVKLLKAQSDEAARKEACEFV